MQKLNMTEDVNFDKADGPRGGKIARGVWSPCDPVAVLGAMSKELQFDKREVLVFNLAVDGRPHGRKLNTVAARMSFLNDTHLAQRNSRCFLLGLFRMSEGHADIDEKMRALRDALDKAQSTPQHTQKRP